MSEVDLSTHPGHLARRLQQAHYLLWNSMVSERITSPQFAVLNALVAGDDLDQRAVGEQVGRAVAGGVVHHDRPMWTVLDGERVEAGTEVRAAPPGHHHDG